MNVMEQNPYSAPKSLEEEAEVENINSQATSQPVSGIAIFLFHSLALLAIGAILPALMLLAGVKPTATVNISFAISLTLFFISLIPLAIYSFLYSAYADNGDYSYPRSICLALGSVIAASGLTIFSGAGKSFPFLATFGCVFAVPTALLGHYLCLRFVLRASSGRA